MDLHFGRPLRHGSTFHIRIPREITPKISSIYLTKNCPVGKKKIQLKPGFITLSIVQKAGSGSA